MSKVKCEITYPSQLISKIGEFEINHKESNEKIKESGCLIVTNNNINVDIMLHVVGILFGPKNAKCYMDVYVDGEKVNSTPIESKFKKESGIQLFNWMA
ncbi:hypothetical protein PbJCM13498_41030 [Prolixibacter bellariivorans]|uniref:Uncharacterized protein n=1 Tax=Prolixibacter bellariivorans TaxID=314319 RepID=A0A5M4B576_9BACT|nr:hypothetical protein [Prolixibacter bellariivorans]GET35240.1 hypothetical protein PbJCM13498_41030 [Prolixibacter bellariivorans]